MGVGYGEVGVGWVGYEEVWVGMGMGRCGRIQLLFFLCLCQWNCWKRFVCVLSLPNRRGLQPLIQSDWRNSRLHRWRGFCWQRCLML